jgi:protein-disulfide isomerase
MSTTHRPRRPQRQTAAARRAAQRRQRLTIWISVAAVAGLVLAGLAGWGVYQLQRSSGHPTPAHATAGGSGLVDGDGPVTVEIWLDPHCPHCQTFEEQAASTLEQLVTDGTITRVYHPVAFLDRYSTTGYSTRASAAVGCAADGGGHVAYLARLLAAQPPAGGPGLSDDQLIQVGEPVGLTGPEFAGCVTDQRYAGWTEQVTEDATRAGVSGTPAVRVDGQDVLPSVEAVVAAVQAAGPA